MTHPIKHALFLIVTGFFIHNQIFAQQWISKDYEYEVIPNLEYGTSINFNGNPEALTLDLYSPICDNINETAKRPLLIWIHGGAFLDGSKNDPSIVDLCIQFAKRGYTTASINYRKGFVSNSTAFSCNYPNYPCVFAADAAEWERAYYRAVQDGKGALRYLVNRNEQYNIDTQNIFMAGESAGAFLAMGVTLLDHESERPPSTYQIANVPLPHPSTQSCVYNVNQQFTGNGVTRPDLGGFEGTIEPTEIDYTIKAAGNMYGAMLSDLLAYNNPEKPKPGIYNFHRPCDPVVPIDSGNVYAGLSWCFTNGYGCFGISNTTTVYGSRTIHNWNLDNGYGYPMQSEFTNVEFPYNYLFGPGSCADQINNPCHAYDNKTLRENNLADFFAPYINTNPICLPSEVTGFETENLLANLQVFPNPAGSSINIALNQNSTFTFELFNLVGQSVLTEQTQFNQNYSISVAHLNRGIYFMRVSNIQQPEESRTFKIILQ
jgi:hypothetical protein